MTARKTSKGSATDAGLAETPSKQSPIGDNAADSKNRPRARKSTARKTTAARKPGVKKTAAQARARTSPAARYEPSDADVRLRAYFIAERRVQLALQGDPARDWIEARQQLLQEASRRAGA